MGAVIAFTLVVHVTNLAGVPRPVMLAAQETVQAMFRDAGIDIAWVDDSGGESRHVTTRLIVVPRGGGSIGNRFDAVLGAAARPAEGGGTAWVFFERVVEHADRHAVPLDRLLACTIAHELGHIVQKIPGHAHRGLMRASWGSNEYRRAALGRLEMNRIDLDGRRVDSLYAP